jgi:hypothetical protein
VLYFLFVCLRLVRPFLPVSLDCPFLIAAAEFSNIYLLHQVGSKPKDRKLNNLKVLVNNKPNGPIHSGKTRMTNGPTHDGQTRLKLPMAGGRTLVLIIITLFRNYKFQ